MSRPTDIDAAVAGQVRYRRQQLGWSQSELSRRLHDQGLSIANPSVVNRWEAGTRGFSVTHLLYLAYVLNVAVPELLLNEAGDVPLHVSDSGGATHRALSGYESRRMFVTYMAAKGVVSARSERFAAAELDGLSPAARTLLARRRELEGGQ